MGIVYPGRCPGLSYWAPLGLNSVGVVIVPTLIGLHVQISKKSRKRTLQCFPRFTPKILRSEVVTGSADSHSLSSLKIIHLSLCAPRRPFVHSASPRLRVRLPVSRRILSHTPKWKCGFSLHVWQSPSTVGGMSKLVLGRGLGALLGGGTKSLAPASPPPASPRTLRPE